MSIKRDLFDIESNGLLNTVDHVWMMCTHDLTTGEKIRFCDDDRGTPGTYRTKDYQEYFNDHASSVDGLSVYGHNIVGYDLPVLKKVHGFVFPKNVNIYDTMLMSQMLNYKRFGMRGHSLKVWGEYLGHFKPEHNDWLNYSPEMLFRCEEDVGINVQVLHLLQQELSTLRTKKPMLARSLRIEHDVARFCTQAEETGWLFNLPDAERLVEELDVKMKEVEEYINPRLFHEVKVIDKEPKNPRWLKSGIYDSHTARYFGITQESGKETIPPVCGPYQRFEYVQPDIGSIEAVKRLLYAIGWEPDDWNWKKEGRALVKAAPKLTSTSLLPLGEIGEKIDTYYTLRSRHQIVSGWIENIDAESRVHGSCFTIGTPTGRATHKGIVNVPSADGKSLYGVEIRKLFGTKPGWKIVGADSSGNQMRAFCHYLKNDSYTKEVIDGDVHTVNMHILREVWEATTRSMAKPFLYAFLFGGGSEKLGLILTGRRDAKIGKKAKDIFLAKTPGLKELVEKIMKIHDQTKESGEAWIPAVDGRRIYIDSPHKALNYLLQSCESVTCKAAVAYFMREAEKRGYEMGVHWNPLIFYHDEFEFECPEEIAEELRVLAQESFREAPKEFGVMIMDGASKLGDTWYDVH